MSELELEVATRELSGPVVTGRPRRATVGWLLGLPALLLVGAVLAAPVSYTIAISVRHYGTLLSDSGTWVAVRNSLLWILVALGVCVLGFGLAVLSRRVRWGASLLLLVLVAPMAVSALVTGVAFRQMYDPSPHRGVVSALVTTLHNVIEGEAPAAGARPDAKVSGARQLIRQPAADGLQTSGTFEQGGVVELEVVGVTVPGNGTGPTVTGQPGKISGRVVTDRQRVLAGVPVSAWSFGEQKGVAVTGADGVFRIDVGESDAGYHLVLPEEAIRPHFTPPDWLGPDWIGLCLASAFVWAWVGFAAALFRAGLDALPPGLLRMARTEGVGRWRQLRTVVLPLLRPVTAVVLLTVVVAAVRLFDLVLVMVPGSIQADADVVAVNWWRERPFRGEGETAALSVVLFAVVAVVALFGVRGLRHPWPGQTTPRTTPRPRRRWGTFLAAIVAVLWAFPLLALVVTSTKDPRAAAVGEWSTPGIASYAEVLGNGLATAFGSTALIAVTATALVLLVAVPAAYQLAWGDVPPRVVKVLVVLLTLLAVAPVQLYAEPLNAVFRELGLANSRAPLILVHAAAGVPFAVLLLRAAFAAAPPHLVASARLGEVGRRAVFEHVVRYAAPALIAVAVLEFVQVWNDFVVGLLVNGATPLQVVLWGQARQFATAIGPVAAGSVVSAIVPLVLLLVTWKHVVRGLTGGGR